MSTCPHYGSENSPQATFCSLCLAKLAPSGAGSPAPGQALPEAVAAASLPGTPPATAYVSPSGFRAMTMESGEGGFRAAGESARGYGGGPGAGVKPAAAAGVPIQRSVWRRSTGDKALLVLKHSLLAFILLFSASLLVGLFIVNAIFSGSESGYYLGLGMQFAAEALLIIWGGYRISMEAMEREKGWIYRIACVAGVVFFWQPLIAFILTLFFTGRPILPQTFSLVGILVAVFLLFPLGALGGWLAEKRYMG